MCHPTFTIRLLTILSFFLFFPSSSGAAIPESETTIYKRQTPPRTVISTNHQKQKTGLLTYLFSKTKKRSYHSKRSFVFWLNAALSAFAIVLLLPGATSYVLIWFGLLLLIFFGLYELTYRQNPRFANPLMYMLLCLYAFLLLLMLFALYYILNFSE